MQKSSFPLAAVSTAAATSSGCPILFIGVSPPSINASYFPFTQNVISVSIIPGETSNTLIPYSASLDAKRFVYIEIEAFEMQYSALSTDAVYDERELINTI